MVRLTLSADSVSPPASQTGVTELHCQCHWLLVLLRVLVLLLLLSQRLGQDRAVVAKHHMKELLGVSYGNLEEREEMLDETPWWRKFEHVVHIFLGGCFASWSTEIDANCFDNILGHTRSVFVGQK